MRVLRLAALGAALMYFFDRTKGAARRASAQDRVLAFFRRRGSSLGAAGHLAAGKAAGLKAKASRLGDEPKDFGDETLKAKVESEVFRPENAPKGDVNVNVEDGVVFLRGQVDEQSMIDELESRVRSVQGVADVENLLHLPGTEAPTKS
jgi:osmotically-inducible protein OsmY